MNNNERQSVIDIFNYVRSIITDYTLLDYDMYLKLEYKITTRIDGEKKDNYYHYKDIRFSELDIKCDNGRYNDTGFFVNKEHKLYFTKEYIDRQYTDYDIKIESDKKKSEKEQVEELLK